MLTANRIGTKTATHHPDLPNHYLAHQQAAMLDLLHLAARQNCHPAFSAAGAAAAAAVPRLQQHFSNAAALQHAQEGRSNASSTAAAMAAAAAAAAAIAWSSPAHADAQADPHNSSDSAAASASKRQRFTDWLTSHGADLSAVAVQPSTDQGSGLGLFATSAIQQHIRNSWLGRRLGALLLRGASNQTVTVSTIPFGLSLTADSALTHPQLGPLFAELWELGLVDERSAVVLLLLLERARGADSPYAPWLQLLPDRFNTPLFWSEPQLSELSGTTLAAATAARKAALACSWQQLQPAVQQMAQQVGASAPPSFEDYLWATSIFWSRGLALPVTYTDTPPQQQQQQDGINSSSGGGSSGVLRVKVLEGLVPGLDFANHSTQPKCWWEVEQLGNQQQQQQAVPVAPSSSSHVVKLMANRACCPRAGEELTISYGDKGNEELLLLYGFAQPQNPHETLMVLCPLPSAEDWDEAFTARMQLLQDKGLRPQLFLSASHLEAATGQPLLLSPVAPAPESDSSSTAAAADSATAASSSRGSSRGSVVPAAARQVLEVFVLDKRELAAALEQQQSGAVTTTSSSGSSTSSSSSSEDPVQQKLQELGLEMAVLTTFARLLELKMIAMEGEGGTGPLEDDLQQLAAAEPAASLLHHQQQQQLRSGSSSSELGASGDGDGSLPAWKQHSLWYRAGQKALVRSYITAARAELQATLAELQGIMEANEYSS